ncbi:MAG: aminopeptidase P family protein [FCB group bacterium]|nr:aminopeptidase P family protein [FCB group bacterium]
MDNSRIKQIQGELARQGIDGWLLYDFQGTNDIAVMFLGLKGIITRRSFYLIPASGQPIVFAHKIEKKPFENLPGEKFHYASYKILEEELAKALSGMKRLAMEYSPKGRLPYIGRVDAGTLELVRSFGPEIVSSADLVAKFNACLTAEQAESHRRAAKMVNLIKDDAFALIREKLGAQEKITEYEIVQFILDRFQQEGMITDHSPICATGKNGGNAHYEPQKNSSLVIERNNLVLIDLWARFDGPGNVYGDITWMAYTGGELPLDYARHFALLCMARDAAVSFLSENWKKRIIYGYEVDDVCRSVISHADMGSYFVHRTGHSIAQATHGPGPNIDNLETEDRRKLMPGHLFSIEPGLYFDDFGLRTEINVLMTEDGPEVNTQPVQEEILLMDV